MSAHKSHIASPASGKMATERSHISVVDDCSQKSYCVSLSG